MTGMWPAGVAEQHQYQVGYNAGYPGAPLDTYGQSTAAGFEGWAVAQQQLATAQQYGVSAGHLVGQQHMVPGHHLGAHLGHHMVGQMSPHMVHASSNSSANRNGMVMQGWGPSHMHMPLMMHPSSNSSPTGGYQGQHVSNSSARGSWQPNQKNGGYGGSYSSSRQQQQPSSRGGMQGGRGGRPRRHIVLNTNPGDFSDAAVEEFASSVKRTPAGQQLDPDMLTAGLGGLDSRGLAALLKELAKDRHARRARELFDFLRNLPAEHALAPLCDVFTYTAMVSMCVDQQELSRAFELVSEMKQRRVECNVHTYTALMNVAIKSGQLQKALEVYHEMLCEGCTPNVVTYNTLIDVYGKTGQWGEALRVIDTMNSSNTRPVTRTYNTLMIACNTSGQWQEALNVYADMVRRGHAPNTTTYNALISAHSKAGRLEKVMEVYQDMLRTGCERSVITYSALISACEKAGQWQLALNLFGEMLRERCVPNVITYNSLITACAQGAQWVKAAEVFDQMKANKCTPDVVTYTALVSAYERGGQWMKALEAFTQMQRQPGCNADAILYNTLLDVLWDTGVTWAQHQAAALFRVAVDEGHFRKLPMPNQPQRPYGNETLLQPPGAAAAAAAAATAAASSEAAAAGSASGSPTAASVSGGAGGPGSRLELGMQGVSPGVAMLMLHCWLADLRALLLKQDQAAGLPERVVISAGRSRQRDHISGLLRDSTLALLTSWSSPFAFVASTEATSSPAAGGNGNNGSSSNSNNGNGNNSKLEAPGAKVAEWLLQEPMQDILAGFMQQPGRSKAASSSISSSITADLATEAKLDTRCHDAFSAVKEFESNHCLSVQSMGAAYTAARPDVVKTLLGLQDRMGLRDDLVHDAVLLMDRAMSASFKPEDETFGNLAAACLNSVLQAAKDLPKPPPSLEEICKALDCGTAEECNSVTKELKVTLKDDMASISALRCLKLYLERLGCVFTPDGTCANQAAVQGSLDLVAHAATDNEFLNYRPTITAAAVLYSERLHKGQLPFWPSSLSGLTSYSNARTPELSAAINGAQRLWKALAGAKHKPESSSEAAAAAAASAGALQEAAATVGDAAAGEKRVSDAKAAVAGPETGVPAAAPAGDSATAAAVATAVGADVQASVEEATAKLAAAKV